MGGSEVAAVEEEEAGDEAEVAREVCGVVFFFHPETDLETNVKQKTCGKVVFLVSSKKF